MIRTFAATFLIVGLSACGQSDNDVGGVSAGEARALNDAAAMLDKEMPAPITDDQANSSRNMADPTQP